MMKGKTFITSVLMMGTLALPVLAQGVEMAAVQFCGAVQRAAQ